MMVDAVAEAEAGGGQAVMQRLSAISLDERTVIRRSKEIEHERAVAIADLLAANVFTPASGRPGPFHLTLAIVENRVRMGVSSQADGSSETILLPLAPFRGIVRDYFMVCESYFGAVQSGSLSRVEALDMGRRSLHDEGSALLRERLADKVALDPDTARRLFTLICVLHLRA